MIFLFHFIFVLCFQYVACNRFNVNVKDIHNQIDLEYDSGECKGRDLESIGRNPKCYSDKCLRFIGDNIFESNDITSLLQIAEKGMNTRVSNGGPTILDINTGYIRDTEGLANLFGDDYEKDESDRLFTSNDFATYGRIINKLKNLVSSKFNIENLYFTAPTFITKLDGNSAWKPREIHDEYWHTHADMNNTDHYQYSGLLYLSTYGVDFTGGRLFFVNQFNENSIEHIVEPVAGRVAIFSSGAENTHYVERVTSGNRYVLAFWFTCFEDKEFEIFLDGKKHLEFSKKIGHQLNRRRPEREL